MIKNNQFVLLPTRKKITNRKLIFALPRWQDNTSPKDLGIIRFGFENFPKTLNPAYGTADWVRPTLYKILKFNPDMDKMDRAWAVCTSRDFSKSTWISKVLPLYLMLIGQYGIYSDSKYILPEADYIRLRAKTQEKAEEKLANVTKEFGNSNLISMFGEMRPTFKEVRDEKLKNTAKMAILSNGYIFQAQGLNVPSRGANIFDIRPKVDIDDDVENKDNTKTETMRSYNSKEIIGEQFGGLEKNGLTIYIGNYVHQECIMAKLQKPDSGWKRLFFQASYIDKKGVERSGWAKRFPLSFIKKLGAWYEKQADLGGTKTFRMEYYNEIISDKEYVLDVRPLKYVRRKDYNFVVLKENGKTTAKRIHIVVSGDPAISTSKSSSDGVVSVIGFGEDKMRYVLDVSIAKFDIKDRYHDRSKMPRTLAITPEEMGNVKRLGMVSEMGRKILQYNADGFVLENAGQQLAWYNDLKEDILKPLGIHIPGLPYHPVDEKVYKLETGLMNLISAEKYVINAKLKFIQHVLTQIKTFPENKLDILDTWFNAEQLKFFPNKYANEIAEKKRKGYYNGEEKKKYTVKEQWMVLG